MKHRRGHKRAKHTIRPPSSRRSEGDRPEQLTDLSADSAELDRFLREQRRPNSSFFYYQLQDSAVQPRLFLKSAAPLPKERAAAPASSSLTDARRGRQWKFAQVSPA